MFRTIILTVGAIVGLATSAAACPDHNLASQAAYQASGADLVGTYDGAFCNAELTIETFDR